MWFVRFLVKLLVSDVVVVVVDVLPGYERPGEQQYGGHQLLQPPGDRVEQQRYRRTPQVLAHRPRHYQELSLHQNTTLLF